MSTLLMIVLLLAIVVALMGIVGAVLPALPGPPLSFASMVTVFFVCPGSISLSLLLWMFVLTLVITVLDYVAPIMLTKIGGGSRYATIGSTVGIIVGLFFMPFGLIFGPLIGAFAGEMIHGSQLKTSIKVAAMSFVSFLLTTGLKLIVSLVIAFYTIAAVWQYMISPLTK